MGWNICIVATPGAVIVRDESEDIDGCFNFIR